jgi:hypothetical protein
MPSPRISIQPLCLQIQQPVPWQITHAISTSAIDSVKGKNWIGNAESNLLINESLYSGYVSHGDQSAMPSHI